MDVYRIVAIDGPAASGKSSVARELARRLGFAYVNSGAIYRAITWHILQRGIDPEDAERAAQTAEAARITCDFKADQSQILINGADPAEHLRDERVNQSVSRVSRIARIRQIVVEKTREYARRRDVVIEGRDIGSVVFPNTPYKFYLDASPEVRFQRRAAQGQRDEIGTRDLADSSRAISPLMVAKNSQVIDTSCVTIERVVEEIVLRLKQLSLSI